MIRSTIRIATRPAARTISATVAWWLMRRPRSTRERGGVWGTGRFPALSEEGGAVGETWFPPRTRAGGERCSCGRPDAVRQPAGDEVQQADGVHAAAGTRLPRDSPHELRLRHERLPPCPERHPQ